MSEARMLTVWFQNGQTGEDSYDFDMSDQYDIEEARELIIAHRRAGDVVWIENEFGQRLDVEVILQEAK